MASDLLIEFLGEQMWREQRQLDHFANALLELRSSMKPSD